jgi:hypothetical protein
MSFCTRFIFLSPDEDTGQISPCNVLYKSLAGLSSLGHKKSYIAPALLPSWMTWEEDDAMDWALNNWFSWVLVDTFPDTSYNALMSRRLKILSIGVIALLSWVVLWVIIIIPRFPDIPAHNPKEAFLQYIGFLLFLAGVLVIGLVTYHRIKNRNYHRLG